MLRTLSASVVVILMLSAGAALPAAVTLEGVCFTPGEDCTGLIVQEIQEAKRSLLMQAYSFTSAPIAEALAAAKKRGVDVRAILDKSQRTERYSGADFLVNAGIPVRIDAAHAIAHNKIIIIDGIRVITGSFNFTKAAQEKNAENIVVLVDRELARRYERNWAEHAAHSEPYDGHGAN